MFRNTALALLLAATGASAHAALGAGDIAFTAFNSDEDGLSFVALADIDAHTTVFFSDNEWDGSAFNGGESFNKWVSDDTVIRAGTVVRLSAYDKTSLSASVGTLSRVTVSDSANWGIANSNETVYAYLGRDALTPTVFLAAVTNGTFEANGPLAGTGLTQGANAIRLNAYATAASPDYAEYTGVRSGLSADDFRLRLTDAANWMVDTSNGSYASMVPDTTAFQIAAVPEPESYALMLAGLTVVGAIARRRI